MKLADLMMPLRVAVTGSRVSPPLLPSVELVGIEKCRRRIGRAILVLKESMK